MNKALPEQMRIHLFCAPDAFMVHSDFFDLSGKVFFAGAVRIGKDSNEGEGHGCQQNEYDCHLLHAPYAIILPPEIDDLSRKVSPWRLALRKDVTYNKYIIIMKRKKGNSDCQRQKTGVLCLY